MSRTWVIGPEPQGLSRLRGSGGTVPFIGTETFDGSSCNYCDFNGVGEA